MRKTFRKRIKKQYLYFEGLRKSKIMREIYLDRQFQPFIDFVSEIGRGRFN